MSVKRGLGAMFGVVGMLVAAVAVAAGILAAMGQLDDALVTFGLKDRAPITANSPAEPEEEAYAGLTWTELSDLSAQVAAASSPEEAYSLAAEKGLCSADGTILTQPHELRLADDTCAYVQLIGINHDVLADGSGTAGLTFMAYLCAEEPMSDAGTCVGGWQDSSLRAWLGSEAPTLLPQALVAHVRPVTKMTNNVGETRDPNSVTATTDSYWVPSAREVVGEIGWFTREYGSYMGNGDLDQILNREGEQYAWFAQQGVTGESDPNGVLAMTYRTASRPWWYRSAYPLDYTGGVDDCYFQVSETGYPSSVGVASSTAGVAICFAI